MRPDQDLVNLTNEMVAIIHSLGEQGEMTDETAALIVTLEGEYPQRVEGVVKIINALKGREAALRSQADLFTTAARRHANSVEQLRDHLLKSIKAVGIDGVKGDLFSVRVKQSPPKVNVPQDVIESLPAEYVIVERKPVSRLLLEAYNLGQCLPEGVTVTRGEHLDIRVI